MLTKKERDSFKTLFDKSFEENMSPYHEQVNRLDKTINETNNSIKKLSKDVSELNKLLKSYLKQSELTKKESIDEEYQTTKKTNFVFNK